MVIIVQEQDAYRSHPRQLRKHRAMCLHRRISPQLCTPRRLRGQTNRLGRALSVTYLPRKSSARRGIMAVLPQLTTTRNPFPSRLVPPSSDAIVQLLGPLLGAFTHSLLHTILQQC